MPSLEIDDAFIHLTKVTWEEQHPGVVLTDDYVRTQLVFIRALLDRIPEHARPAPGTILTKGATDE